jgi:hypothetical protein
MKSIPFIILFALIVGLASGQEAAIEQKVQYNNIPANFSTGSPNISIPLWTASGKSFKHPNRIKLCHQWCKGDQRTR